MVADSTLLCPASAGIVVVVIAPFTNSCVEVSCDDGRPVLLVGLSVYFCKYVVHALHVLVAVPSMWEVSRDDSERTVWEVDVDVGDPLVDCFESSYVLCMSFVN